jgi:hypothetical protein
MLTIQNYKQRHLVRRHSFRFYMVLSAIFLALAIAGALSFLNQPYLRQPLPAKAMLPINDRVPHGPRPLAQNRLSIHRRATLNGDVVIRRARRLRPDEATGRVEVAVQVRLDRALRHLRVEKAAYRRRVGVQFAVARPLRKAFGPCRCSGPTDTGL